MTWCGKGDCKTCDGIGGIDNGGGCVDGGAGVLKEGLGESDEERELEEEGARIRVRIMYAVRKIVDVLDKKDRQEGDKRKNWRQKKERGWIESHTR